MAIRFSLYNLANVQAEYNHYVQQCKKEGNPIGLRKGQFFHQKMKLEKVVSFEDKIICDKIYESDSWNDIAKYVDFD